MTWSAFDREDAPMRGWTISSSRENVIVARTFVEHVGEGDNRDRETVNHRAWPLVTQRRRFDICSRRNRLNSLALEPWTLSAAKVRSRRSTNHTTRPICSIGSTWPSPIRTLLRHEIRFYQDFSLPLLLFAPVYISLFDETHSLLVKRKKKKKNVRRC